jgi:hypothetical protein
MPLVGFQPTIMASSTHAYISWNWECKLKLYCIFAQDPVHCICTGYVYKSVFSKVWVVVLEGTVELFSGPAEGLGW